MNENASQSQDSVIDQLIAMMSSPDHFARAEADRRLCNMGKDVVKALPVLRAHHNDTWYQVTEKGPRKGTDLFSHLRRSGAVFKIPEQCWSSTKVPPVLDTLVMKRLVLEDQPMQPHRPSRRQLFLGLLAAVVSWLRPRKAAAAARRPRLSPTARLTCLCARRSTPFTYHYDAANRRVRTVG
jgi:hypothetical protein